MGFNYKGNGFIRVAGRTRVGAPLGTGFGLSSPLGSGFGLGFGLGSSLGDLDDHFRWLEPIDLNLDPLGITHLDHESIAWCNSHASLIWF